MLNLRVKNLLIRNLGAVDQLALLRFAGLLLKIGLTFFAADTFGLSLTSPVLYWGMSLEALYLGFTFWHRSAIARLGSGLFIVLLLDTLFWISWLYFTGGATNAFISLLLLPTAIAAVVLPTWAPWVLALISTLAYSLMIFSVPESQMKHHGMDMSSHYLGMWFNFLISSLVLTTSVAYIAQRMRKQEVELGYMREAQLRQERLIALGTASAQMAHQLATPLASLRLLVDEAVEDAVSEQQVLHEMDTALVRCEQTLNSLRMATESIRQQRKALMSAEQLAATIKQQVLLLMPEINLELSLAHEIDESENERMIQTDASLLPALLALIENAGSASLAHSGESRVLVSVKVDAGSHRLCISVKDFGAGIPKEMQLQLGHKLVESERGMGMALLLSNASFERLGGQLLLSSANEGGTIAKVCFPVSESVSASQVGAA
ncbi:HAMP domain-containing histidine kinase [Shewanella marinintestina]|uniref:sensor histidine kinase n=1 Tax=Shewanella marinintestina TaxID=190305 RepID=UPI00200F1289|nr:HAMP domain-containing sensor histidine kinase [Shewanella marinintestina]MCL1145478.1 HAMP domain-containing histidine kinase [Shewanella marinintestina]